MTTIPTIEPINTGRWSSHETDTNPRLAPQEAQTSSDFLLRDDQPLSLDKVETFLKIEALTSLVIEIGRELEEKGITEEEQLDDMIQEAKEKEFRQKYGG